MKTYTVLYAEEVPHYGIDIIEAADDDAAIAIAKAKPLSNIATDPDYENAICKRIVHIEDAAGNVIATDIAVDNCFVRYGGDAERLLCDLAADLLVSLQTIAAIPLWGEAIEDATLRENFVEAGEYDDEHGFEPSADTESSYLREAIELARSTLAKASYSAKAQGGVA